MVFMAQQQVIPDPKDKREQQKQEGLYLREKPIAISTHIYSEHFLVSWGWGHQREIGVLTG